MKAILKMSKYLKVHKRSEENVITDKNLFPIPLTITKNSLCYTKPPNSISSHADLPHLNTRNQQTQDTPGDRLTTNEHQDQFLLQSGNAIQTRCRNFM